MKTRLLLVLAALLTLCASASAAYYVPKAGTACKTNYRREVVKIRERHSVIVHGHVEHRFVRRHGRVVWIRQARCYYVAPPITTAPTTPTTPNPTNTAAQLDPSYTQDPSNPLKVTWTYSASDAGTHVPPPPGSLILTVSQTGQAGSSGECSMDVGGSNPSGGTCTLTLPQYGSWDVTVSYSGSNPSTASPSTETQTENIEPPPATVQETWGTTPPSDQPAISAKVIGPNAQVKVTDANFEGATSLGLVDNLSDTCTATVSGTTATCSMSVTGIPSSFTVNYPGGTTQQTTQTVPPNGVQSVSYVWGPDSVQVPNPTVTRQYATLVWQRWQANSTGGSGGPPDPLATTVGQEVQLYAEAQGSLSSDFNPQGYVTFTVTQQPAGTNNYTAQDPFAGAAQASNDCSQTMNGAGQAVGGCNFVFSTPGSYTIEVSFTDQDGQYGNITNGLQETVNVS